MIARTMPQPHDVPGRLADLERSNRNLSMLIRSAPIPVLLLGQDLRIADYSPALLDVARIEPGRTGAPLASVAWMADMDWLPDAAQRVLESGVAEERTVSVAALDARFTARVLPWAAQDGPGIAVALQPLDSAGGVIDQIRCRDAFAGLQTLKHQLSNTMMLTRSVIRRSAETAESLEDYVLHLEARLDSIHRILATLVREPQGTFDLREMIETELDEQGGYAANGARLVNGPPIAVRAPAAQVLALVVQELVTNAVQHGVLGSEAGGQLHVGWSVVDTSEGQTLQMNWTERGAVPPPRREGFGTTVLDSVLSYQLDGRAERSFGADGARISLTIPLANLVSDQTVPFGLL